MTQCASEGAVRLVNGDHDYEGQVQVCENGEWEYICVIISVDWTINHGKVVCRSLGYSSESKISHCMCASMTLCENCNPIISL